MKISLQGMWKARKPTPSPKAVFYTAESIVGRQVLIEEIKSLPDSGYAMLVLMKPNENGEMMTKSISWPANTDPVTQHGLEDYAMKHIVSRMNHYE